MIHHHTANGKEYLLVKVPKDARDFICWTDFRGTTFFYFFLDTSDYNYVKSPYPCRFLFRCSEATEEQAQMVVDGWPPVWKDATTVYQRYPDGVPKCRAALESLASLCESIGWGLEETVVVEKV